MGGFVPIVAMFRGSLSVPNASPFKTVGVIESIHPRPGVIEVQGVSGNCVDTCCLCKL